MKNIPSDLFPNIYTNVDLLKRLKYKATGFSFFPEQPVDSVLTGINASRLRGRGLNFEEMRQYHIGDDIRTMDWKVTLRTKKPHVKVFTEERERNVILLVDQRLSMFFGSEKKMKSVIAAEAASLASWKVIESTDRLAAIIFNDEETVYFKPQRSSQQVVKVLSELVKKNQQLKQGSTSVSHSESINRAFERLSRVVNHDTLVILISDGRGWDNKTTEYIRKLRQHSELILFHIVDHLERTPPPLDQMVLSDGQLQVELSTQEPVVLSKFADDIVAQLDTLSTISKKYKIPVLSFDTLHDTATQVRKKLSGPGA